jgi:N-acetylmuramoyl-L-alanine amidase
MRWFPVSSSPFTTTAVIVALTAVAVALPAHPARADNTFVDDDTSIFERDIEAIAAAGITAGCSDDRFCPRRAVTRGQMAAFLRRGLRLPASDVDRFVDDDDSIFERDIEAIAAAGITAGCNLPESHEYCPDRAVTRGQMAAFLRRGLRLPASDDDRFVDDDDSIFEADIQALAAAGITAGCGDRTFCPDDDVTRGQMAAFLTRALDLPRPADPTPDATEGPRVLRMGDEGSDVVALQERLLALGYWMPAADGRFGVSTHHAVVALQKAAGITRDGIVGPVTHEALARRVRPEPRTTAGTVIEIDRASQLLLLVTGGELRWVVDTSTGDADHTTPGGWFTVFREIDGYRESPLGTLYRPKYFNSGIAIHGSPSVPPHAASHGCVRVTNTTMDWLWAAGEAPIGRTVVVR